MKILVLCIGTEKISGDSIGPIVGSLLKEKYKFPYPVLGDENSSVNGSNIGDYKQIIKTCFADHRIIAVDSAVGESKDLWSVKFREGGVRAGGAVSPSNEFIGDVGILGVVGEKSGDVIQNLMSAPYAQIFKLATYIAELLVRTFVR